MKKNSIIQFVCFITDLELDEFIPKWERYADRLKNHHPETTLQQAEHKAKYRFISQHFPEHNVKVVQIGGYTLLEKEKRKHIENNNSIKLIAFISHDENEIDFYKQLPSYCELKIYQPYYESCSYGYVLEYFVPETDADELVKQLKQRKGVELGVYKECMMYHV